MLIHHAVLTRNSRWAKRSSYQPKTRGTNTLNGRKDMWPNSCLATMDHTQLRKLFLKHWCIHCTCQLPLMPSLLSMSCYSRGLMKMTQTFFSNMSWLSPGLLSLQMVKMSILLRKFLMDGNMGMVANTLYVGLVMDPRETFGCLGLNFWKQRLWSCGMSTMVDDEEFFVGWENISFAYISDMITWSYGPYIRWAYLL